MNSFKFLVVMMLAVALPHVANGANPGDIVINEVMQNPNAVMDAMGEWFEIYNRTSSPIDIDGWCIEDDGSDFHQIDNGGPLTIPAEDYLVLGRYGNPQENGGYTPDYVYANIVLGNGDDEIVISEGATEIARIDYDGGTVWPDPAGASMGWIGPPTDYQDGMNWTEETDVTYGDGDFGTPGEHNSDSSLAEGLTLSTIYSLPYARPGYATWWKIGLKNSGDEMETVDLIRLDVEGPISRSLPVYTTPIVLGPGEETTLWTDLPAPMSAPLGNYTFTIVAVCAGEDAASDSFQCEVVE